INVLYAGRLSREKGIELLADSFLKAHRRDSRLRLVLAGGGPEEGLLRRRLGEAATFLGWRYGDDLARVYASADAFLFTSETDTYGQVVVEAQASGTPVVAVASGGPSDLIEDGRTGMLRPPDAEALADALLDLTSVPALGLRIAEAGLAAARQRTWAAAMAELAAGYDRALQGEPAEAGPRLRPLAPVEGGGGTPELATAA
ncbi:MAG TPA: glycosyltransferase, partial [Solirubrobacterales bacterium]|nr:glycosyltransferase [Solirubrobacterales bacterium]